MTRLLPSHSLNAWNGSLDGRVHLSPFVSLPLFPVVSQPGCLARLSGWTGLFVSLCLPSFVSRCLPAWMPGTGWTGSFVSLCPTLSPFICLPLSPSLAWMPGTALGGRVHLSPFVSLHVFVFSVCLPFSGCVCLPVSRPGCLAQLSKRSQPGCLAFICVPSFASMLVVAWHGFVHSPFVSLHLSLVVSEPGCLARLCEWTDSFVSLFSLYFSPVASLDAWDGSLPAWMPGNDCVFLVCSS